MPKRLAALSAGVFCAVLAAETFAAEVPHCAAGEVECGREAFARGTESFDRGDYADASVWYSAAAAADPHPAVLFNWALSEARSGKLVSARARLEVLLADSRTDATLRKRAERERDGIDARVARIRFELLDLATSQVELDGAAVDIRTGELSVDPGAHRIRVSSSGAPVFDQVVELAPGERLAVRLGPRARAIDIVVVPAGAPTQPPKAPARAELAPSRRGVSPTWFYVAAGASVALAGASVWSGFDVQRAYDEYREDLPELTQAQADDRVESGHARELRTNLLLGATAVAALGTAALGLFVVEWSDQRTQARLTLTPSGLNVKAQF